MFWRRGDERLPIRIRGRRLQRIATFLATCSLLIAPVAAKADPGGCCARARSCARTSLARLSEDAVSRRGRRLLHREQVRRSARSRRIEPRSEYQRDDSRAGWLARRSRSLRAKSPDRCAANRKRDFRPHRLSRRRAPLAPRPQHFVFGQLRHRDSVRRSAHRQKQLRQRHRDQRARPLRHRQQPRLADRLAGRRHRS